MVSIFLFKHLHNSFSPTLSGHTTQCSCSQCTVTRHCFLRELPSAIYFNTLCKNNSVTGPVMPAPTQRSPQLSFPFVSALSKSHTVPRKDCTDPALPELPARSKSQIFMSNNYATSSRSTKKPLKLKHLFLVSQTHPCVLHRYSQNLCGQTYPEAVQGRGGSLLQHLAINQIKQKESDNKREASMWHQGARFMVGFLRGLKYTVKFICHQDKSLCLLGLSVSVFQLSYLIHKGSVPPVLLKTNKA